MKILIVISYSSVYGGNFIPSISKFATYCISKGDTVGFAFPEAARQREWCQNLSCVFDLYFWGNSSVLNETIFLNKYIKRNKYDTVYSHFSPGLILPLSVINNKIVIIRHVHTDMGGAQTKRIIFQTKIKRVLFYRRMANIYVSERLKRIDGSDSRNCFFIPNALDVNRFAFASSGSSRGLVRGEHAINDSTTVILTFGWNIYVKGVDISLQAFEKVLNTYPDTVLMIVLGENQTEEFAKKYVNSETLKHIIFLPPVQDVGRYHAASDIFLSSSRSEGFSYSILEALYLGKAVVSSNLSAVMWASQYNTVSYFQSEDVDSCVQVLNKMIRNLNELKKEQQAISEKVADTYSLDKWVRKVYGIIESQYEMYMKSR